jgi:hypothetical protein
MTKRRLSLTVFGVLLSLFVIVNFGNALHKGGDFKVSLEAGHRFLTASPLYEGSSPGLGVTGPPFQSVWFAPFAAIANASVRFSQILWYLANIGFLLAGIWCWTQAILPGSFSSARELWSSPGVLLPLLVGESGYNLAREFSNSTLAAILVIGILTPVLIKNERSLDPAMSR